MIHFLLFLFSVLLAIYSVTIIQKSIFYDQNNKHISAFSLVPLILLYILFISSALSIFKCLDGKNFLITQMLLSVIIKEKIKVKKTKPKKNKQLISNKIHLDFSSGMIIFLIIFSIFSSFLLRLKPLTDVDDLMYRGSTSLYWIQNKSIFPFETANDRKRVFIYTTGVIQIWPLLFDNHEIVSQVFYWLSFPITIWLIYLFSEKKFKKKTTPLFFALLFSASPLILHYFSTSFTQDLWLGVVLLGYVYLFKELLAIIKQAENHKINTLLLVLGSFSILLASIKINALVYILLILLLKKYLFRKKILWFFTGFIITLIISGYGLVVLINWRDLGSPLGKQDFRQLHAADISAQQILVHLVRFPFILFDPPTLSPRNAEIVSFYINQFARITGAAKVLPKEQEMAWLGTFRYHVYWPNSSYGIAGIAVLFIIMSIVSRPKNKNNKIPMLFLAVVILQVCYIRWANFSNLPQRHLIAAVAIFLAFGSLTYSTSNFSNKKISKSILITIATLAGISLISYLNFGVDLKTFSIKNQLISANRYSKKEKIVLDSMGVNNNILVIEDENFKDYFLFFNDGHVKNSVYLLPRYGGSEYLNNEDIERKTIKELNKNKTDYLVFDRKDIELTIVVNSILNLKKLGEGPDESVIYFNNDKIY